MANDADDYFFDKHLDINQPNYKKAEAKYEEKNKVRLAALRAARHQAIMEHKTANDNLVTAMFGDHKNDKINDLSLEYMLEKYLASTK